MKPNSTPEEFKTFMSSLGFDYYDGYYQCFKKEEGNCEITMTGAKDLQKSFQRKQLEARLEENLWWINYLEHAIVGKDAEAVAVRIFKVRIEKHRERIAELTKQLKEKS